MVYSSRSSSKSRSISKTPRSEVVNEAVSVPAASVRRTAVIRTLPSPERVRTRLSADTCWSIDASFSRCAIIAL